MDRIFENKQVRRLFFIIFGLTLLLYVVIRLWVGDSPTAKTFIDLADKFAMSLAVSVFLGAFLFYIAPKVLQSRQLDGVPAGELASLFKSEIEKSRSWTFKGTTGRYVRSQVIPRFLERTQQQRQPLSVTLILLDVTSNVACEKYADYRNSTETGAREWTSGRVKQEVCATLLSAMAAKNSFLRIEVALSSTFSILRADISDSKVILTKEDPSSSALVCDHGNRFYDYFVLDARMAESQARRITFPETRVDLATLTTREARETLQDMGLVTAQESEDSVSSILQIARQRRNPYPG